MRKIVVANHVTLDGVMQAPGGPDEDPRDDFAHGGWAGRRRRRGHGRQDGRGHGARRHPAVRPPHVRALRTATGPTRRTQPVSPTCSTARRSTSPRPRCRSRCRGRTRRCSSGDVAAAVAALKEQQGKDIVVLGSGELVRSLMRARPDRRVPADDPPARARSGPAAVRATAAPPPKLRLVDSAITTTTGVVIATYQPGSPMKQYLLSVYQPDGRTAPPDVDLEPIMARPRRRSTTR